MFGITQKMTKTHGFGDVLLLSVSLPAENKIKKRAIVVISNSSYNQRHEALIAVPITKNSCVRDSYPDSFKISRWQKSHIRKKNGSSKNFFVVPIVTIFPNYLSFRKIGDLTYSDKKKLKKTLAHMIGMD